MVRYWKNKETGGFAVFCQDHAPPKGSGWEETGRSAGRLHCLTCIAKGHVTRRALVEAMALQLVDLKEQTAACEQGMQALANHHLSLLTEEEKQEMGAYWQNPDFRTDIQLALTLGYFLQADQDRVAALLIARMYSYRKQVQAAKGGQDESK